MYEHDALTRRRREPTHDERADDHGPDGHRHRPDPTGTGVERNRAVVARLFAEVLNGGRVAAMDELTTEGSTPRASHLPEPVGRDGHRALVQRIRTGSPDLAETVVEMVAEGDRVVTHLRGEGAHTGAFLGIPPTGRRVRFESVDIDRVEDGSRSAGCCRTGWAS